MTIRIDEFTTASDRSLRNEAMRKGLLAMQLEMDLKGMHTSLFYDRPMTYLAELKHRDPDYVDDRKDQISSWVGGTYDCTGGCGNSNQHEVGARANHQNMCNACRDKLPWPVCITCGQLCSEYADNYFHLDPIAKGNCFSCYHWMGVFDEARNTGCHVILDDGDHYSINLDRPMVETDSHGRANLGHSGHEFTIRFNDGRYVDTNNMWSQGTMRKYWLGLHPPNARLVTQSAKQVGSATRFDSHPFGIELLENGERIETLWYDDYAERDGILKGLQTNPVYLREVIEFHRRDK